ncbi:MAG: tetratricopeptide repeat protein [Planctomycetota bacterium]|jgi:tetratricopeptide (TPR) repeat protein
MAIFMGESPLERNGRPVVEGSGRRMLGVTPPLSPRRFRWIALSVLSLAAGVFLPSLEAADDTAFQKALQAEIASKGLRTSPAFAKNVKNGILEMKSRNYLTAVQHFGAAYRESKEHPFPPFLIGIACIGMDQIDKASEFVRHALKVWPKLPKAKPDLRSWLMSQGEYDRLATKLENELFSRKPETAEGNCALFLTGFFLAFGGDQAKAQKYLAAVPEGCDERAAARIILSAIRPAIPPPAKRDPEESFKRGNQLFTEGKYGEAAHAFGAAIVRNPKDPLPYFEMGHALFAAGYFRHAARVISLGIELYPDWGGVEMDRAAFYPEARRKDFGEQLSRLKAWTASHPADGAALYLLGYNLYFSSDPESSRTAFQAAVKAGWAAQSRYFLDWLERKRRGGKGPPPPPPEPDPPKEPPTPKVDPVKAGREKLAVQDYDGAEAAFLKAVAKRNRNIEGMMGLASVALGRGNFQDAALWVRMALRADWDVTNRLPWTDVFGKSTVFTDRMKELETQTQAIHQARKDRKTTAKEREIWFLFGYGLYRQGEKEKAADQFLQIILDAADTDAEALRFYRLIKE